MRKPLIAVALLSLVMVTAALASDGFLIRSSDSGASTYTGSRADDPIVFPGRPGATHMHDFFCNKATTASSTYGQMVLAATTCPSGDTAGYWAPALYKNGVKINPAGRPTRQQLYYRDNNLSSGTRITAYPPDFKMVVGDARATSLEDANAINSDSGIGSKIGSEIYWGCSDNSSSGKATAPVNCSTGIITLHVGFPNCWNGVKVAGDQIAAGTMRFPRSGACPSGFNIALPRLIERFEYPVGTNSSGITLASGPIYTVHADFWNTWNQATLEFLVQNCLNAGRDCGTNPSVPNSPPPPPSPPSPPPPPPPPAPPPPPPPPPPSPPAPPPPPPPAPPAPPPPPPPAPPAPPSGQVACKVTARGSGIYRLDLASYPAGLTRVDYFIDGQFVAEDHTADKWDEEVPVASGQHTLVCRATINGGQVGSAPLVFAGG